MGTMGNAQNVTGYPQSQFQRGQIVQNPTVVPQSNNARLPGMPEIQQPMLPHPTAPTQENDYELPDERVQYYD